MELDKVDKKILELLQADARLTHKEIANATGLSTTPVYERVKRLERTGYITGYVALVDPKKMGIGLVSFVRVSLRSQVTKHFAEFEEEIHNFPQVLECYAIAGTADYLLKVAVKNMDEYRELMTSGLSSLKNISTVQSAFVMDTVKHSTEIPV